MIPLSTEAPPCEPSTALDLLNAPSSLDFPRASRLAHAVRGALLCASLGASLPLTAFAADGAAITSSRAYAIPAGPLGEVLNAFAREAGITLSATPAQTAG